MKITPLGIEGVWLAESPVFSDNRGYFREWFKAEPIRALTGSNFGFEQANISSSSKGTLRGIHYSIAPKGQAKWITCVSGAIKDVIVDIRPQSKSYGEWIEVELTGTSGYSVYIEERLGHGFLALEDNTTVSYLVSTAYSPAEEFSINPLDEKIGINWGVETSKLILSNADRFAPTLNERLIEGKLPS